VGSDITLILENNITLRGSGSNRLVSIGASGNFIMNNGSTITGNTTDYEGEVNKSCIRFLNMSAATLTPKRSFLWQ